MIRFPRGTICPDCLSRSNALRVNGIERCKCGRFARELHESRAASDGNDEILRVTWQKQSSVRQNEIEALHAVSPFEVPE